jgi:hypothetical protein
MVRKPILVTITDENYVPEEGTPFDAVVSALEHFEIPAYLVEAQETIGPQRVEIEHWDSPRYKGGGDESEVYTCEIEDRRAQSGQLRITIGPESGDTDDFVDVLAEINTPHGSNSAVPCFHVAADADHRAFSIFKDGNCRFLIRLEACVQLVPITLPDGSSGFLINGYPIN